MAPKLMIAKYCIHDRWTLFQLRNTLRNRTSAGLPEKPKSPIPFQSAPLWCKSVHSAVGRIPRTQRPGHPCNSPRRGAGQDLRVPGSGHITNRRWLTVIVITKSVNQISRPSAVVIRAKSRYFYGSIPSRLLFTSQKWQGNSLCWLIITGLFRLGLLFFVWQRLPMAQVF